MAINIEHLPAVATLDWCDRAAESVASGLIGTTIALLVCTLAEQGRVVGVEALGVACRPRGTGEDAGVAMSERLNALRSQIEVLSVLPLGPSEAAARRVPALVGQLWREEACVRAFQGFSPQDVAIAVHRIPGAEVGRSVVTLVAFATEADQPATPSRAEELSLLLVANGHIAQRAAVAIGVQRSTRARWISEREREVLDRLVLGMSVRQIAGELGKSTHTVHDHVKSLHKKLGASSRGELVARALGHLGSDSGSSATTLRAMPGCAIEPSRPMIDLSKDIADDIALQGGVRAKRLPLH